MPVPPGKEGCANGGAVDLTFARSTSGSQAASIEEQHNGALAGTSLLLSAEAATRQDWPRCLSRFVAAASRDSLRPHDAAEFTWKETRRGHPEGGGRGLGRACWTWIGGLLGEPGAEAGAPA